MTKPLKSFKEWERKQVAQRRAGAKENGIGKVVAQDFLRKFVKDEQPETLVEVIEAEADEETEQ